MFLSHTEIKKGTIIILNGDPYEVLTHSHSYKGRGSSVMQTRIKNLKNGSVIPKTFHTKEKAEEAEIEKEDAVFVYSHRNQYVFAKKDNPKKRFTLEEDIISNKKGYLKQNTAVTMLIFNDQIISISVPVKVSLIVKESPPGIKGDRSQGGTKTVTLETGLQIEVPLFIKEKDTIEINTETGEYVRRI